MTKHAHRRVGVFCLLGATGQIIAVTLLLTLAAVALWSQGVQVFVPGLEVLVQGYDVVRQAWIGLDSYLAQTLYH